ncbi:MAG: cell division protein FtsX [Calditrichia bacterium]
MKILFLIKEGILGFKRARMAATISIATIALSLTLGGGFTILMQNLSHLFRQYYQKAQIEVYVNPSLTPGQIKNLRNKFLSRNVVESAVYISPEQALKEFEKEFGADLIKVLDENPLPPTIRIVIKPDYSDLEQIELLANLIKSMKGVDDVVYQKDIIRVVNRYFLLGILGSVAVGIIIFLISTLLIFNTIRLTIFNRKTIIEIMRLVGATNYFIKGPFIIEGMLQGILGSGFAGLLLWLTGNLTKSLLAPNFTIPAYVYLSLLATGTFLGFLGSYFSVNKYLKY